MKHERRNRVKFVKGLLVLLVSASLLGGAYIAVMPPIEVEAARDYSAVFNADYYAASYPDVVATVGNSYSALLSHFLEYGMAEGRRGCDEFDVYEYRASNPDLAVIYGNNLKHYYYHFMDYGKPEGRLGRTTSSITPIPSVTPTPGAKDNENNTEDIVTITPVVTTTPQPEKNGVVDPVMVTAKDVSVTQIKNYFKESVFVGDSIMVGFRNYVSSHPDSPISGAQFLAATSFSAAHACNPVSKDSLQPTYQGAKRNVWDSISMMGAKHVFVMFGTNDLIAHNVYDTEKMILQLIDKILEVNPDVDIHVISMTPILATAQKKGALNNESIPILNKRLYADCLKNGYSYVELHKYLVDENGGLRKEYCSDKFVHLTPLAYEKAWEPVMYNHAYYAIKKGR